MPREVHVHIAHPRLKADKARVATIVHVLDRHASKFRGGCPEGELSIAFLTDKALARIHDDFLSDPSTTDVITFEGNAKLGSAGEICVSADTAASYASQHDHEFARELALYVVHGWLHLAGYDDLQPAKKRLMRAAEKRAMTLLEKAKALPLFLLKSSR
jgi:probable rRNA maturation factor